MLRLYVFLNLMLAVGCSNKETVTTVATTSAVEQPVVWHSLESTDGSTPIARHEAAFVAVGDKFYLLGGRGIKPVSIYDTKTNSWTQGAESPIEIHHFQPVVYQEEIYLLGAMTGPWPGEIPVPNLYIYNPASDEWRLGPEIPAERRRGGAGAVLHEGKIYLVCGIKDGHRGDHKTWLDSYDLEADRWTILADAPRARDHFQAVVIDDRLYAAAGRRTGSVPDDPFGGTEALVDVYDLATNSWTSLADTLPTPRAGNAAIGLEQRLLILGGESPAHEHAHHEVEALDVSSGHWQQLPPLSRGRHGTGVVHYQNQLLMASGCGNRGGNPELADLIQCAVVASAAQE
ncbi:MAG: galactose oxidase [Bacteroidota bacterium]